MKKMTLAIVLALFSAALFSVSGQTSTAPPRAVVHLSHFTDDLHAGFMAVKLANVLQSRGTSVTLFVDLEGARLADDRQSLGITWGPSETPLASYYGQFVQAGGSVLVCPHCAKAAGITEGHVRDGAKIATEDQLAEMLLDAEKILDY